MQNPDTNIQIKYFQMAKNEYPFDYKLRTASALRMGELVLTVNNIDVSLQEMATKELDIAISYDNSAELLGQASIINLNLKHYDKAQKYYDQFKIVDHNSRMNEYIYNLGSNNLH